MTTKFGTLSKEAQKKAIEEVITRVEDIEVAEVGIIAAQDIIDIVIENFGPEIYNLGLRDAKKVLSERISDIETDIDLLEKQK